LESAGKKNNHKSIAEIQKELKLENTGLTDREIAQWVPLRTMIKDANTKFGKKLQQAHELFHQDEFEQSNYMYQDMMETRIDCDEVFIGLSASFYFLKKYEEASASILKISNSLNRYYPNRLSIQCEKKLNEEKQEMINIGQEFESNNLLIINAII
jgi:thioredoxin-like negative regulator of GroEL